MNDPISKRFVDFYQSFSKESVGRLEEIYDANVLFKDPIHEVRGLAALELYFSYLCDNNGESQFTISDKIVDTSSAVEAEMRSAFFRWNMTYRHPKLANGKKLHLDGGSMVRFDEKIHYQEDFYDLGQMVYQHIPLVGWAVKKINKHLAGPSLIPVGDDRRAELELVGISSSPLSKDL